jgi:hypothetical protein
LRLTGAGTTLTIGPGITIEGQNGVIGYATAWGGGPSNVSVINEGTVVASVIGGTIAASPESFTNQGTVSALQGNITLNSGFVPGSGALVCGLSSSNSYGQIQVSGAATLGGTLDVVWLGGFVPAISNSFTVVTYGSFSGLFSPLNLPAGPAWQTNYTSTALILGIGDIDKLVFTSQPVGTSAGTILTSVVVQVEDSATGNPVATNGVPVTIALATGDGTLSGTLTQTTDPTGKATFNDLSINLVGTKMLIATAIPSAMTPVTSSAFSITVAAPAQLALVTPITSPQQSGVTFSPAAVVQVQDRFGNIVSNSLASITAQFMSTGSGTLLGTITTNANGTSGIAIFSNLRYNLGSPTTAESVTIYFTSPGLALVPNNAITVDFVFSPFTLQNGNSVIQIDPTTQDGAFSWTVDGVDQLYQKWFWFRQGSSTTQISVDEISKPFGFGSLTSSNATITYFAPGLAINLGFALTGGASGSYSSLLSENISIQNTTNIAITFHFFEYTDFDLNGEAESDTVFHVSSDEMVQQGKGMMATETISGMTPNYWQSSWYAITLDELIQDSSVQLADESIPSSPGDQTYAYEWDVTLGAGQNLIIDAMNVIQPMSASVQLSIVKSGENVILSWPTNVTGSAQLETTGVLGTGANWTAVTNSPAEINGQYQVTLPCTNNAQFYRLAISP